MREGFDHEAFFAALDTERLARLMTWREVAEESGVNASTLSRMGQGKRPDVDSLAKLLSWSNLKAEKFIPLRGRKTASSLAEMTALLRADPKLSPESKIALEQVIRSTYSALRNKR